MADPSSIKGWEQWRETLHQDPEVTIPDDLPGTWWVVHARPRNEKALARDLRALGIFHYLPLRLHTTRSSTSGRFSRSIVPVFPGYLFLNTVDPQRQAALQTNRIVHTLPVANQAELVGELRQIQRVICTQMDFSCQPRIEVGGWVRVIDGPLAGAEGIVCKHMSRTRLALSVRMLSQSLVVEVSRAKLEAIDAPSYAS